MKGDVEASPGNYGRNGQPVVLAVAPPGRVDVLDAPTFLGRMPNVGILYLASALERAGYACEALDRHYDACSTFELASEILSHGPRVVGFTLFDLNMEFTEATMKVVRKLFDGPIVVGGYTATFHAEDVLTSIPEVDYVLAYEAEDSLLELMRHLDGEGDLEDVPNLYWRSGSAVKHTGHAPLVDVTEIPWPKRHWDEIHDVTPIITRRGCTSACSFCAMVPFYDRQLGPVVRFRDVDDVVDEIEECIEHGRLEFMFYDDDFGLANERERAWSDSFAEEVRRRGLRFQFGLELRVKDLIRGEEQLRTMTEVGLTHMAIGMESLLPRQLKLYQKGYRQQEVLRALEAAARVPAYRQTNVILWDPWSTLAEVLEHLELLDGIGFQDQLSSANYPFYATTLTVRRGTSLYSSFTQQGLLRRSGQVFYRYDYDFQDPETARFHRLFVPDFTEHARRAITRPAALWMVIPRLHFHGHHDLADELQRCGAALARTEFEYFRRYVGLATEHGVEDPCAAPFTALHDEFAGRLATCVEAFPAMAGAVLAEISDGVGAGRAHQ